MISTSRLELSLYRALHLCKTAFHPHIGSKECGGGGRKRRRGEVKVQTERLSRKCQGRAAQKSLKVEVVTVG